MEFRKFKYEDGSEFTVPLVVVSGFYYVKIKVENILKQLPVIVDSIKVKTKPKYVTWHWTAAPYDLPYNHYQVNVGEDYILVSLYMTSYSYFHHTWKRNSLNLGISYMAMGGKKRAGIYAQDIRKTPQMMKTGSVALAALKKAFGFEWSQVTDHDAFSKLDGYDSYRWDNQLVLRNGKTLYTSNLQEAKWIYDSHFVDRVTPDKNHKDFQTSEKDKHKAVEHAEPVCRHNTPFEDVCNKDWYADDVQYLYDLGIVAGEGRGNKFYYNPHVAITRAEAATMVYSLFRNKKLFREIPVSLMLFKDVSATSYYRDAVETLFRTGIMQGKSKYMFEPLDKITRAEMASLISRSIEYLGDIPLDIKEDRLLFNDLPENKWYTEDVKRVVSAHLMVGRKSLEKGNAFEPLENIKRSEMAVVLSKMYRLILEKKLI
jgi:hypothetical protein